ncbi:CinA family protein [Cryobacterium arcticum]|uniref:Competence damage-inducible protein A n=1 Tax=Cryobacterium arcticum TaxID=670052 RepID=A0A1B1BHR8_9MICO|nr:CinA family protein [Cryobacterium arcticum]ANP72112.1 competence damage-inducible protein A [Cryobacterium arcticum]
MSPSPESSSRTRPAGDADVAESAESVQTDAAAALVALLTSRHLTIAVAESLTGGLLVAELVRIPGASAVVLGGVVAYQTALKHTLLGVDDELLAGEGAVHPEVARQMATGVRDALAVDGRAADIGLATTGVAGPDEQDGRPVGTVYLGIAIGDKVRAIPLHLTGDRGQIRAQTVYRALEAVCQLMESGKLEFTE